jgi:Right handed beta helix region
VDGRVVSSVGGPVEYWVQYGRTTAYGSETPHANVTVQANTPWAVFVQIGGLARETEYHYRLCASDSQQGDAGPGCGVDRTFVTESALCNTTLTSSVRLTADVACFSGDGTALVIGADGIDVNLAGHRVDVGVGSGGGPTALSNSGHDNVTIRNGTVQGAIEVEGASGNVIHDLEASSGRDAISVEGGIGNAVTANDVSGRLSGIAVNSDDAVVSNNDAIGAHASSITVTGDRARVVRNRIPAPPSEDLLIGIELRGSDGRVVDNQVTGGWLAGGIVLDAGANEVIAENEVSDIRFAPFQPDPNLGDGIVVKAFTAGTLLRNNLSQRNDGDGIDVRASDARLRDNSAFDNRLLGINAVAGVTDLGGNRAHGNGNALQCVNVLCSP